MGLRLSVCKCVCVCVCAGLWVCGFVGVLERRGGRGRGRGSGRERDGGRVNVCVRARAIMQVSEMEGRQRAAGCARLLQ